MQAQMHMQVQTQMNTNTHRVTFPGSKIFQMTVEYGISSNMEDVKISHCLVTSRMPNNNYFSQFNSSWIVDIYRFLDYPKFNLNCLHYFFPPQQQIIKGLLYANFEIYPFTALQKIGKFF